MPLVAELNTYRTRYLEEVRELVITPWPARGAAKARLRRAVGHALEFGTWQSLVGREGCTTREAVRLMVAFVGAAASGDAGAQA